MAQLAALVRMEENLPKLREEFDKFQNKGNHAAGTRARKIAQQMVVDAKEVRAYIQAVKNEA